MVRFKRKSIRRLERKFEPIIFGLFRKGKITGSEIVRNRRVKSWLGTSITTISKIWWLIRNNGPPLISHARKEHLLWALLLLKGCDTDANNASRVGGVDERTFASWAWYFIDLIASMKDDVILWENRKINDILNDCLVSVDGVDCRRTGTYVLGQPDKAYYSQKFRGPALRYEVAVCIRTGDIVWIAGPCLPGVYPDITIFRDGLIDMLEDGERVEADEGYIGECPGKVKCASRGNIKKQKIMKERLQKRHETINERLKNYTCLEKRFRHSDEKHGLCFAAAAVLTQLAIEGGEELFCCPEYDDSLSDRQVEQLFGTPDSRGSQYF